MAAPIPVKTTWASIVTNPPPHPAPAPASAPAPPPPPVSPVVDTVSASWFPELPPIPAGSVLSVRLESVNGWIVGKIRGSYPRTLQPSQLWTMFPHLRKHLFAHHDVDYDWLEPGGMYFFFARPGVTRKTYPFEGSTYIIDFTGLGVGNAEYCPICKGPIIKKYHSGFGGLRKK